MIPMNLTVCRVCHLPGRFIGRHGALAAYRCQKSGRLWQTVLTDAGAAAA